MVRNVNWFANLQRYMRYEIRRRLEMLDTPGILVPKINDYEQGYRLVLCSLIKDDVVHLDDIAVYLLKYLALIQILVV